MIRQATINDLEELCIIEKLCFKEERYSKAFLLHLLKSPDVCSLVFEENKRIVGSVIISFHRNTCRIISIAVHPLCRKKGVGKKLLASAEEKAQQLNIKNIVLEVSTKNRDAINFYLSNKYKIDHVIENYYGIGRDAYRMRKNLGELTD